MACYFKKYLIIFVYLLLPLNVAAETDISSKKLSCFARHLDTDKLVEVKTVSGIASSKIATAQWPLGYPTIVIDDSAFVKLPKNAKQFIYYHECAHLTLKTEDEHEADCESVNLLVENHVFSKLDVRKLVQTLSKELGWSRRWQELLSCESVPE
jgi:hypothetical protein